MELPVNLDEFASALVIKPSSFGDIIHTLPAVHAIKHAYPQLNLRWLSNPEWMPLLEGSPDITQVIPFPRKEFKGISALPALFSWARKFNAMDRELPELALDFQGLFRSGMIARTRGASPVLGLSDAREGAGKFYDHTIPVDANAHAVDRYLELPRALGISVGPQDIQFPLPLGQAKAGVTLPENYILIHPYSRGEGKSLRHEVIQSLTDCLSPHQVIVVGVSPEAQNVKGVHVTSFVNDTTLLELIWLIRNARGVVSVDSGPMHLASAITSNLLGIHTWSNPRKVGPYDPEAWILKAGRIAHRQEFTDEEVLQDQAVETSDARRMADFVLRQWFS